MEETVQARARLLRELKSERWGEVAKSTEYGKQNLVSDIIQLALRCEISGSELNGMAVTKWKTPFRELDDEQLTWIWRRIKKLHDDLNTFPIHADYQDPQHDDRTQHEREWDNEILLGGTDA